MAFDAVDPDALVEGNVVAFGVRLPAGSEITGEDPFGLQATVPHSLEKVSSYMRVRLDAKAVETGPQRTVFIDARRLGATEKEPHLKIIVARDNFGTKLTFTKTPRGGFPSPYVNREEDQRPSTVPPPGETPPPRPQPTQAPPETQE